MKKLFVLTAFCLTALLTKVSEVKADNNYINFVKEYNFFLLSHVSVSNNQDNITSSLVDYETIIKDSNLIVVSDLIKKVKVDTLTPYEKVAFYINAYNFYVIELIVTQYETKSILNISTKEKTIYDEKMFLINGTKHSLNDIKAVILETYKNPKIIFTLACGALSCPDLLNYPYKDDMLYLDLEKQTIKFLNNPTKGLLVDDKSVKVSKYITENSNCFDNKDSVKFIKKYIDINSIDGNLDFNWDLNILQVKSNGRYKHTR